MVIELNRQQLSPHPASAIEVEQYYALDYINKFIFGRALSVDGGSVTFDWPRLDDTNTKHTTGSCVF